MKKAFFILLLIYCFSSIGQTVEIQHDELFYISTSSYGVDSYGLYLPEGSTSFLITRYTLLSDGENVGNKYIEVEKWNGTTWVHWYGDENNHNYTINTYSDINSYRIKLRRQTGSVKDYLYVNIVRIGDVNAFCNFNLGSPEPGGQIECGNLYVQGLTNSSEPNYNDLPCSTNEPEVVSMDVYIGGTNPENFVSHNYNCYGSYLVTSIPAETTGEPLLVNVKMKTKFLGYSNSIWNYLTVKRLPEVSLGQTYVGPSSSSYNYNFFLVTSTSEYYNPAVVEWTFDDNDDGVFDETPEVHNWPESINGISKNTTLSTLNIKVKYYSGWYIGGEECAEIRYFSQQLSCPELDVYALSCSPASSRPGEEIQLNCKVRNISSDTYSLSNSVQFKLIQGVNSWDLESAISLSTPISSGSEVSITDIERTLPTGLSPGSYYLKATLVNNNDCFSTNNATQIPFEIYIQPDLDITNFSVSDNLIVGKNENLNMTVKNVGLDPVGASTLKVYLDDDVLFTINIPALDPNEEEVVATQQINLACDYTPGPHILRAHIDEAGLYADDEITLSNNVEVKNVTVHPIKINFPSRVCEDVEMEAIFNLADMLPSYSWTLDVGGTFSAGPFIHTFDHEQNNELTLTVSGTSCSPSVAFTVRPTYECTCVETFMLVEGKEYLISGWCSETSPTPSEDPVITYTNALLAVNFILVGGFSEEYILEPTGKIIDGWQKIEGAVEVPAGVEDIEIKLINLSGTSGQDVYFDDIRVYPVDGKLNSYVYNIETGKLDAVMDENNFATYYEYDQEGKLIRVKKETERGVKTISESFNNNQKQ